jgi:hypothetical protein
VLTGDEWLRWLGGWLLQDPRDLRRLLDCMIANKMVAEPATAKIVEIKPYEYLATAEHNCRNVGFVPKGTQVCCPAA